MEHRLMQPLYNHRLREERLRLGWSQRALADHLGTTTNNVSRWELGQTTPGPYFRAKLCALFGKSAQALGLAQAAPPPSTTASKTARSGQTPASSPCREVALWTVPYPRNPHFTGREELLKQLAQLLSLDGPEASATTRRVALVPSQAIKGLGGIGKTQIAVEYVYRAREQGRYTHTLWVNAVNEEAIMTSFLLLADLLPDFPARSETDQRKLVVAIKHWLEQCEQEWLLIFDNADDLALAQKYFPRQGKGSILLTTRANATGSLASSLEVETMGFVEGTNFLLSRVQCLEHVSDDEMNEAGNIVVALDHFPLALDQAGAYIDETKCRFSTYLQLYQDHRKALLARRGIQLSHYPDSVATTWSLSFQRLEQVNPAAVDLLKLCAFLTPDHIPEELLTEGAGYWPPMLQQAVTDLFSFNQVLEAVLTFSLVKRLAEEHLLSIHRLVQAVLIDMMDAEELRQWAERVVRALNAIFPSHPEEIAAWPRCLRYLAQVQACNGLIQQHQLLFPEAADLLDRTGIYLCEHALYPPSDALYQQALQMREQLFGPEHPTLAISLNNLASLYRKQGKYAEAEPLFQRALQIWEQQPGSEHPNLASPLAGLAYLYAEQGKYAMAEPLFLRALQIREQTLGAEHLALASPLTGLANLYREQGKYAKTEPLLQRARRILEEQLGSEHPTLAYPLHYLGILYTQQVKYAEAESLFQQVLSIREHALVQHHPDIADTLYHFAALREAQGRLQEAASLYCRAFAIREHVYGPLSGKTIEIGERLRAVVGGLGRDDALGSLCERLQSLALVQACNGLIQ